MSRWSAWREERQLRKSRPDLGAVLSFARLPSGQVHLAKMGIWVSLEGEEHQYFWHEIATAHWNGDNETIVLRPVVGGSIEIPVPEEATSFPDIVRERMDASVVTDRAINAPERRDMGRVALRKDLRTQELFVQVIAASGADVHISPWKERVEEITQELVELVGI